VATDIKICGLTRSVDAEYADAAGVEYLGVIFAGGPRERTPAQARDTLAGRRARKAGVFADQAEEVIASVVELVGLDVVQLHGRVDADRVERCARRDGARGLGGGENVGRRPARARR
jgi:phosphoribosylanthranilate isomerase